MSVALVDSHPFFIRGVASLLEKHDLYEVVAIGGATDDAVQIAVTSRPDLLVLDIDLGGREAFSTVAAIAAASKSTKIVAFTAATGVDSAVRAFEAGASGYVLKSSSPEDFLAAIQVVLRGGTFINPSFAAQVVGALRSAALRKAAVQTMCLSVREQQIIQLLLEGRTTNKEIADSLSISVKTVKYYMTLLMQKMHARNRLEVLIAAQKMNSFQPNSVSRPIAYN